MEPRLPGSPATSLRIWCAPGGGVGQRSTSFSEPPPIDTGAALFPQGLGLFLTPASGFFKPLLATSGHCPSWLFWTFRAPGPQTLAGSQTPTRAPHLLQHRECCLPQQAPISLTSRHLPPSRSRQHPQAHSLSRPREADISYFPGFSSNPYSGTE